MWKLITNTQSNDKTESNSATTVEPVINLTIRITEKLLIRLLTIFLGSGLALVYQQLPKQPQKTSTPVTPVQQLESEKKQKVIFNHTSE